MFSTIFTVNNNQAFSHSLCDRGYWISKPPAFINPQTHSCTDVDWTKVVYLQKQVFTVPSYKMMEYMLYLVH